MLAICHQHGWLADGSAPDDAIASPSPCVEGDDAYWPVFDAIQGLEPFHALAHHPQLMGLLERLIGEPVLAHARNIFRIIFPENNLHTTPPHQDYLHIRGTPQTYTAWLPVGDCPRALGGLTVLAGSHQYGLFEHHLALGAGRSAVEAIPDEGVSWRAADYQLGDCLLFHSHTVHQGLYNQTDDRLRISVDYRYQSAAQPVMNSSLVPHLNRRPWAEYYRGWTSSHLQRYWEAMDLQVQE